MKFDKENVESILYKLIEESNKLRNVHSDIEKECKMLNGEYSWNGKGQESFYKSYLSIASNFDIIDDNIDDCNKFLRKTIMDYVKEESGLNNSVDNNILDIK